MTLLMAGIYGLNPESCRKTYITLKHTSKATSTLVLHTRNDFFQFGIHQKLNAPNVVVERSPVDRAPIQLTKCERASVGVKLMTSHT